jgi:signal transduction histidine kinase
VATASRDAAGEIESLRRCINDLVSIQALPAMWSGGEPVRIVNILLEALVEMLGLDFAYARVTTPSGEAPLEIVRVADDQRDWTAQRDLAETFQSRLGHDAQSWPPVMRLVLGGQDTALVPLQLGVRGDEGCIVAGSRRADFPRQTERLVLTVAVNQAVIGLQEAQLRSAQRRATRELDERVAQRTAELAASNAELEREAGERKRAEEERRRSEEALDKARSELAHVTRVMSLGTMTASIAHEVNQPLSGIITNGNTCLRMLAAEPPNIDGARETARRTIRDGSRAVEVIQRLRALFSKEQAAHEWLDLNAATREVMALSLSELQRQRVVIRQELAAALPAVTGDRVQLQQVILNLLVNAADAMSGIDDRPRELLIRTEAIAGAQVSLSVRDTGMGFEARDAERLFTAFYTTKRGGMGIGLSVSRSIIENHRGRLWASVNAGPGATFAFSIPCRAADEERLEAVMPLVTAAPR